MIKSVNEYLLASKKAIYRLLYKTNFYKDVDKRIIAHISKQLLIIVISPEKIPEKSNILIF